jgi:spermidine/putrescine transport system substrate-binding protein
MTDPRDDELNILLPIEAKPRLDHLHRKVEAAAGMRLSRREALGLGGMALLGLSLAAAGCGTTTTGGDAAPAASPGATSTLAGLPMESKLQIYNWVEYDPKSVYKGFTNLPDQKAAGLKISETYFSSNDELLAKLHAGATGYDILVPSQNAVAQLIFEKKLMALDPALLPNLKNLQPSFRKTNFDPTGQYSVVKAYGITGFFYNNTIVTEQPKTLMDFYQLLNKYVSKGRTNLMDGPEEVPVLALLALGINQNTTDPADYAKARELLMSVRKGVTTIDSSAAVTDGIAGKIVLGQEWNGNMRRIVTANKGDITAVIPEGLSEIWADNWCIPADAPHPVAAHAWINYMLEPDVAVDEMNYHNYAQPNLPALAKLPAELRDDPLFNVPAAATENWDYTLNISPAVVQMRTKIFTEFKAAG